jgi:hypothetical protein
MGFMDFVGDLFSGGGSSNAPQQQGQSSNIFAPGPGGPSGQPGGGDLLSSLLLGVGAPLLSRLIPDPGAKAQKNLGTVSNEGTNIGKALMDRAAAGKLTDPQQAQVDAMKKEQNARNAQYLASLGIPVSTANVQMQGNVDANAVKMANDLINQSFQQGISALGLGGQASNALITQAAAQKKDLSNTIGEVAKQIGAVMNQPTRPDQGGGAPANIASGAQAWGEGDYDPYAGLFTSDAGT